jgi:hypothetical protein
MLFYLQHPAQESFLGDIINNVRGPIRFVIHAPSRRTGPTRVDEGFRTRYVKVS